MEKEEFNDLKKRDKDSLLGALRTPRAGASAFLFRDPTSKHRDFEKRSPEGLYQLAVCLRPHSGLVIHDGHLVHDGFIPRGGVNLYTPGEHITVSTQAPWEMLVLFFRQDSLVSICEESGVFPSTFRRPSLINPAFAIDSAIYGASTRIADAVSLGDAFGGLRLELAVKETTIQLLSAHSDLSTHLDTVLRKETQRGLSAAQLRRAYEALSELTEEKMSLSELSGAVGCSPSHFSRAFKASTGQSPFQWLLQRRIDRAKDLLLQPGTSLADLAQQIGFAAQPQFTTAFKRVTGMTPGRWRELHRMRPPRKREKPTHVSRAFSRNAG